MIYGLGIDLADVKRIKKAIEGSSSFTKKIFTESEIAKCEAVAAKYQCYAARFAGKEAFLKALGTGLRGKIKWTDIEIFNDELGKPELKLSDSAETAVSEIKAKSFHISLTHLQEYAAAVVIIEI